MLFVTLFLITTVALGTGFFVTFNKNKMSLLPSSFLLLLLNVLLLAFIFFTYTLAFEHGSIIARAFLLIGLIPYVLLTIFGSYVAVATLMINAQILIKREGRSLAHILPLALALFLAIYWGSMRLVDGLVLPSYIHIWIYVIYGLIGLYLFRFIRYITATILLLVSKPKLNQDYIIVHGSGLINGNVPPLLAGRIDKAIAFYHAQKKVRQPPKLILSGGQGSDEPKSEALAMAEYAQNKGIPRKDLLLEEKSTTTFENLTFAKKMMDEESGTNNYTCIFSTSNYHLLRTGIYAKLTGLHIQGIGSKTALYYLPNAFIREYIAHVMMNKKRHILLISIVFLITAVISIILFLML